MKTLPKPKIECGTMEIKLPKYQELLMMEKEAIPELQKHFVKSLRNYKTTNYISFL